MSAVIGAEPVVCLRCRMQFLAEEAAIGILEFEHRHIDRVLAVLSAECARANERVPRAEVVTAIVQFIEEYADGRHHAKEENVLFEQMCRHGYSRESGPLACMIAQHEMGRQLTAQMKHWVSVSAKSCAAEELEPMLQAACKYVDLLTRHVTIEDSILFPSALVQLPQSALLEVARRYHEVDPHPPSEFAAAAEKVVTLAGFRDLPAIDQFHARASDRTLPPQETRT
jgi:hemerythrin-like domain-containing protein